MTAEPLTEGEPAPPVEMPAPSTEQLAAQAVRGDGDAVAGPSVVDPLVVDIEAPNDDSRDTRPSGAHMTVTQAIRLNRSKRKTMPPNAPVARAARPVPPRAAWKDGLFPAVFGALFSARWVVQWARDGQVVLAVLVGLAATAGLFAIGVGASRWLGEPAEDPHARR